MREPVDVPSNYKSPHLFLLIGTNPLPDLVAAIILAMDGAALYLVHTSETENIAGNLKTALTKRGFQNTQFDLIEIKDPSDPYEVETKLSNYLSYLLTENRLKKGEKVGLNYTGGTKVMAVHVHSALEAWCRERSCLYTFSYLDPRKLSLRFKNMEEYPIHSLQVGLDELVKLHGRDIFRSQETPVLSDICLDLATKLGTFEKLKIWRTWCNRYLRSDVKKSDWEDTWKEFLNSGLAPILADCGREQSSLEVECRLLYGWGQANHLKGKKKDLESLQFPPPLKEYWPTLADFHREVKEVSGWGNNNQGYENLVDYLDGEWLESCVQACLQEMATEFQLHDIRSDIKVSSKRSKEFQFDVAALSGYRLIAFSCTTEYERGSNKTKLFEAYQRARQMGGDEACVALVGGYEDPKSLLDEVNEEWIAPRNMIRVFGPEDWPHLSEKLRTWLTELNVDQVKGGAA